VAMIVKYNREGHACVLMSEPVASAFQHSHGTTAPPRWPQSGDLKQCYETSCS